MNRRFLLLLLIALLAFSASCRNTSNVAAPAGGSAMVADRGFTLQDMRAAIFKGCADKHWSAVEIDANTIEAMNIVRNKHTVVVSIPYTASSYSINYKRSSNMGYKDKGDGTFSIHSNYNAWVGNLKQAIDVNIAQKKK